MSTDRIVLEPVEAAAKGRGGKVDCLVPRILLADDQEEVRETLVSILEDEFQIVGLAGKGDQVLELATSQSPDVLVLDVFMPGMNGIEAAALVKASGSATKVIFLTVVEDPDFVDTVISVGAFGYVVKAHLATDLIPAIRSVLDNQIYISPVLGIS